ncbi:MAG: amidohydrolase family protein [Terriglobales bacterium]
MRILLRYLLTFVLSACPALMYAQQRFTALVFRHANVISMSGGEVLPDRDVLIEGGVIKTISAGRLKVGRNTLEIPARGRFLIPGLADMHIHTDFGDEQQLQLYLIHGVTTALDLNGSARDLEWRRRIAAGELLGPTLYVAGGILDGDPKRPDHVFVKDRESAQRIVRQQAEAGYDFVKPYSSLTSEAYYGILEAAKQNHLRVVGHVPRAVGVENVLRARQDAIAHYEELYRYFVDRSTAPFDAKPDPARIPALIQEIRGNQVWIISTLSAMTNILDQATDLGSVLSRPEMKMVPASYLRECKTDDPYANKPKSWVVQNQITVPFLFQLAGKLNEGNVPLMAGTDATNPIQIPGASMHDELEVLVRTGLSPYQALLAATRNPALFLNRNAGTVAEGEIAELVLLDASPLGDIKNTRKIRGVVKGSIWLDQTAIRRLKNRLIDHFAKE